MNSEFWQNYFSSPFPHLGLGLLAGGNQGLATGIQSYINYSQMLQQREQQNLLNELRKEELESYKLQKQKYQDLLDREQKLNQVLSEKIPQEGISSVLPYLSLEEKAKILQSYLTPREVKPFTASPGSAVFGLPGMEPGKPYIVPSAEKTQYKERYVPTSSTMQQLQVSMDGGVTWQNVGVPRPIHAPPIQVVSYGSPQPIPDPNSPTGFSYAQFANKPGEAPYRNTGAPAPAPAGNRPPGEVGRMNVALEALAKALDSYEQELKNFNPRNPVDQADPQKRARLSSLYGDVMLQMKEAQALGALQQADLEIMSRVLADPTGLKGAYYGVGGLQEQIKQARDVITRRRQATEAIYPSGAPAQPKTTQPTKTPQPTKGKKITIGGKEYEVIGTTPDGGVRIRDPRTGRTGTYRGQ